MPLGWRSFKKKNASAPNLQHQLILIDDSPRNPGADLEDYETSAGITPHYVASAADYYRGDHPSHADDIRPTQRHIHSQYHKIRENQSPKLGRSRPQHTNSRSDDVYPLQSDIHVTPLWKQTSNDPTDDSRERIRVHIMSERKEQVDYPPRTSVPVGPPSALPSTPSNTGENYEYGWTPDSGYRPSSSGRAPPTARPPRQSSTTSGSSAYTGYIDGPPSPHSSSNHPQSPPLPSRSSVAGALPISATTNEDPSARTRSNERRPASHPATGESQRKRTLSTPRTREGTPNPRSQHSQPPPPPPPPPFPSNIAASKYSPSLTNLVHSTPVGVTFPKSPPPAMPAPVPAPVSVPAPYPSPTTSTNPNFIINSPVAMPSTAGPSGYPEYRPTQTAVHYRPESPPKPSSRPSEPTISSIVPPPRRQTRKPTVATSHACLSLHRTDRVRLIKFPDSAVQTVKSAIERSWAKGFQHEKEIPGSVEFQLRGNPWSGQGDEAVPAVYTMCEVMSSLYHLGWNLVMSTDISKRAMDKDTLVYRQGDIPSPKLFMAVSFNDGDRLRLIKAPNDVINAVKATWGGNIQKELWRLQNVAWEFKLAGNPWWSSGDESIMVRILLLNMLDALAQLGWELHATVDLTAGPGGLSKNAGSDTDCWFLRKHST